jgi:penicillin amidase
MVSPDSITDAELTSALPDVETDVTLNGLTGPVTITRDGHGIPHVLASTSADAFFGQGFATAQDRLWHMDYDRMKAYGRWAEFAGPPGVDSDLLMRRMQVQAAVIRDYQELGDAATAMLDAYAAGVNAFVESTNALPLEYGLVGAEPERWRPWDCLAVYFMRHVMMGGFEGKLWRAELVNALGPERAAELYKSYQPGHLLLVPPGMEFSGKYADGTDIFAELADAVATLTDPDAGSNSWALTPDRTTTGAPIIAGDPHRGLDVPNVYYQNHITCPDFDVIGMSFPGCPGFPHFGHNARVAWCVTHAMADYQDLYVERFNPENSFEYEFNGEWRAAQVVPETIKVRGEPDMNIEVVATEHGPVVAGDRREGTAVTMKYTALDGPNPFANALRDMMTVGSVQDMDEAMRPWVDPCNNFMFADIDGGVRYLNRGRMPIRPDANFWLPVPGWTGEHEWTGFISHEDLPRVTDPEGGVIVTANQKIVGDDFPYMLSLDYSPGYRARRIYDRLSELGRATPEQAAAVHAEQVSVPATVYCRLLASVPARDDRFEAAREMLTAWDGAMERDRTEPTIYSAMRLALNRRLAEHCLGPLAAEAIDAAGRGIPAHLRQLEALFVAHADVGDTSLLPEGLDWATALGDALSQGVDYLTERLGSEMSVWTWGSVHGTRPVHTLSPSFPGLAAQLDPPSVAMGGDGDTPQAGFFAPGDPFTMMSMSVARYLFDPSNWDGSKWIVPLGASGHPGSPHYFDQLPIWAEVKMVPMTYSAAAVRAAAQTTQTLNPS